jgi:hypothetical protein
VWAPVPRDLITILDDLRARGVKFHSPTEAIDLQKFSEPDQSSCTTRPTSYTLDRLSVNPLAGCSLESDSRYWQEPSLKFS